MHDKPQDHAPDSNVLTLGNGASGSTAESISSSLATSASFRQGPQDGVELAFDQKFSQKLESLRKMTFCREKKRAGVEVSSRRKKNYQRALQNSNVQPSNRRQGSAARGNTWANGLRSSLMSECSCFHEEPLVYGAMNYNWFHCMVRIIPAADRGRQPCFGLVCSGFHANHEPSGSTMQNLKRWCLSIHGTHCARISGSSTQSCNRR